MKRKITEKNKLPHDFEYLEFKKVTNNAKPKNIKYFVPSIKLQTDFMPITRPFKNLVRLI